MSEKDSVIKEKLKYAGLVNFKGTYAFAHDWLKGEGFSVTEELYTEKIAGDAKELEIKWKATKMITDYFKIDLSLKWKILGMKNVDVEIDGKKKSINKVAELSIEIKGELEKDWSSKWNANAMNKFFKEIYQKFVIPGRTLEKKIEVKKVVQDFKEEMKALLELTGRQ